MNSHRLQSGYRSVSLLAVLALALMLPNASMAKKGKKLELHVVADPIEQDVVPSIFAGQGPFYIPGKIFDKTGKRIGDFHCWGFFIMRGASTVVSQEYDLWDRGKIQVQGIEDGGPRAVTGGTGDFRDVRGEMTGADLSEFPEFTVTFKLLGVKRGKK